MQLILHFKNEKIDLSGLTAKDSDFEKMWVARLHTQKFETLLLRSHFPMSKKEAETIGVYYKDETPQYIHRRLVHNVAADYLIVVEAWMLEVYFEKKAFQINFQKKQEEKQTQKALRAEQQEKMAKRVAFMEQIADDWLEKSKRNFHNWREAFEAEEVESDKLLQLLDKKMLS